MGYEKPSTKLTFYKAFFSTQWKFLIHTILQSMSAKRTSWNEFSSVVASTVICLSTGKGFSGVETPLYKGILVGQEIEQEGGEDEHVEDVTAGDDAQGDDTAAREEVHTVTQEPSIPSPTLPTPPPQPPKDLPSTSQRIDTSDDTVMDDESNKGRIIDKIDKDDAVALMDDKEEDKKDEEAKEDEPAEVQEVVDIVATAKLITKSITAASEIVTAISIIIAFAEPFPVVTITSAPVKVATAPSKRRKGVVIRDPEEESTTSSITRANTKSKDKGKGIMDVAINHVKHKAKEDPAVKKYQAMKKRLDYFKGMSYDDIRLIFKAKFNSNVDFLLMTKEQMEEEDNRVLQTINETPTEKAAKRRKLNKEVEDLKRNLEIVPD
nr:hypothetical protein [Tanacetum cinerariifolium]